MAKKKRRSYIVGTLQKNKKGFGFVIPEVITDLNHVGIEDIYVSAESMHGAMNGDKVEVDLIPKYLWGNSPEGIIVNVLERNFTEIVGTFQKSKKFGFVIPDDRKLRDDIFIAKKYTSGAKNGDKVVAQIMKYPEGRHKAEGKITEIVAKKGEPGGDILALIRQNNLYKTFPSKAAAEAKAVSKQSIKEEEIKHRKDLRNLFTVTIDGADSKDFDDAVSVKRLENGNYQLGVHIADVCHYVKENGSLDKEALKRGNSVYLIDQVVPMLPEALSNGICSLNPDEDRLTLTCQMEIDETGKIVNHEIFESVIHSHGRLVYDDVSDIIESGNVTDENKYLFEMAELAEILHKKKEKRGSLDFNIDEAHITLDKKGVPIHIGAANRRVANRMIEEFMLTANETVAEHFFWMSVPFVYRVHEKPSFEKMEELKTFLAGMGISLTGNMADMHPAKLSHILEDIKDKDYEGVINNIMLRSMQKATYETDCGGHFGLALKYYCHFTSPIRRYPDLMIHRIIKKIINGGLDEGLIKYYSKKCEEVAIESSKTERRAIELEREVEKMKMAEYMSYHVGETFDGVICGVTNFGIYVELPNCVEGMVKLEYINDDYYEYEREKYRVRGQRTNKIYALGDKVKVKVHSVYMHEREINFVLA